MAAVQQVPRLHQAISTAGKQDTCTVLQVFHDATLSFSALLELKTYSALQSDCGDLTILLDFCPSVVARVPIMSPGQGDCTHVQSWDSSILWRWCQIGQRTALIEMLLRRIEVQRGLDRRVIVTTGARPAIRC